MIALKTGRAPASCGVWLFCATLGCGGTFGPSADQSVVIRTAEQTAHIVNPAGIVALGTPTLSVTKRPPHILRVGPGQQYPTIAAAISDAQNGDTIFVRAGTYTNDFSVINKSITLQGVDGMVDIVATKPIPNGKAIFVTSGDITISRFSFSGAQVSSRNGSGIRYESGRLVLNDDYFHDNEEGLLAASDPNGTIAINRSEFSHNGSGDGQTHNIYVNDIARLTVDRSYVHDAVVGHEIKSRARETIVKNSRIHDGATGTASYSIDLPNGGRALIENNVIEQGPRSENPIIITSGEEGGIYTETGLIIRKNQILNDLRSTSALGIRNATASTAQITANEFYGLAVDQIVSGLHSLSNNTFLKAEPSLVTDHPWAK